MAVRRRYGAKVRGVQWRGMDELQRTLAAMPEETREMVRRDAVGALADAAVSRMRALVPVQTGELLRTTLRGRVERKGADEFEAVVGTTAYYWHFVEYGVRPHSVGAGSDLEWGYFVSGKKGRVWRRRKGRQKGPSAAQAGKGFASVNHPGHAPHPYLRPAIRHVGRMARRVYENAIQRAIKRAAAKAGATLT